MASATPAATAPVLLSASLALLYFALRSRIAALDASAFARLRSWEPQVATALAAAVFARAAAATDAVARLAPGGRLAGAPRMAVACGVTLLATAGGKERVGPAAAAWLLAASAAVALLWSWGEGGDGGGARGESGGGGVCRGGAVIETTPAALAQELDAEAALEREEQQQQQQQQQDAGGKDEEGGKKKHKKNNKKKGASPPSPLVAVLFYDPRGGSRAAAVSAAFDALSEEEEEGGARGAPAADTTSAAAAGEGEPSPGGEEEKRPLVLYRRLDASRWPEAAGQLGASWETASHGSVAAAPPTLPALALFRGGEIVASSPGEGGRLPASVEALRRVITSNVFS